MEYARRLALARRATFRLLPFQYLEHLKRNPQGATITLESALPSCGMIFTGPANI
jgi:hypothetical protein